MQICVWRRCRCIIVKTFEFDALVPFEVLNVPKKIVCKMLACLFGCFPDSSYPFVGILKAGHRFFSGKVKSFS